MKALMIVPMMIAGLIVVIGIFVLRVVGLVAVIAGGFGLLATFGVYVVYEHAPTAAHWLALQRSGSCTAVCIGMTVVASFGPRWLFPAKR